MDARKRKRFHLICVAVIVAFFAIKIGIAVHNSIYILAREQLAGIVALSIILIVGMYEKIKSEKRAEDVSSIMTAWYLGFGLAIVLSSGLASIKEQDWLGREMRAKMTDEEWEELNDQIREDARQDYYENRRL